ncbi:MAG TPA: prephenate dehydrogenase/arogenate dehydrogenase family protein [Gemmatimonadales bacterium]|nr:prephenate dehydrogenase/arogenate dehydrogenase family protein [Gemmatimonadales bacterium]
MGLGAIGGSVAWRARLAGVPVVLGYTPDPAEGDAALEADAVTALAPSAEAAARHVQLLVLATPPRATLDLIELLADRIEAGTILSDVASVKAPIMALARARGLSRCFVGAHPLAGTHGSGFAFATPDLLRGCLVYLCYDADRGEDAGRRVAAFWSTVMEATPVPVDPSEHDRQLAWTSHLPQAVAYALARVLADRGYPASAFGSGARDTTRLAASRPELWLEIFLQNREPILQALDAAGAELAVVRDRIADGDEAALIALLTPAADFRRSLER